MPQKGRLFFLGAGFSAAAGIPLTGTLLHGAMALLKSEVPGLGQRIEHYARVCQGSFEAPLDYSALSLDDLCTFLHFIELREHAGREGWSELGSRELLALRYYLAKRIALSTPPIGSIPELYLEFARELRPSDFIVSFNWDCLLERALNTLDKPYVYSGGPDDLVIMKPHGSINWARLDHDHGATTLHSLDWGDGSPRVGYAPGIVERTEWPAWDPLGGLQPFLVLPGFGKALEVRRVAPLWYKPERWFAFTRGTYIIGLSLRPDDFFIRSLFLDNLQLENPKNGVPRVFIINPDPAAAANYAFALGSSLVRLVQDKFSSEHLALLERDGPSPS